MLNNKLANESTVINAHIIIQLSY